MYRDDIETILRKTSFLSLLPEKDLEVVIDGFSERRFTLGNTICKAGESSDSFYVIYSGKARLVGLNSEGRETTMATLVKGDHFGEQTVLTGEASEFTVRASGELVALELPRARFLEILQKHPALKEYFEDYISDISLRNFIRQCSVFSPLDAVELRGFLECFRKASFQAGDFIVHEGDEGNAFYLIRSGDVEVIKESQGGKIVNRLGKGQFFGELALLTGAPRAAGVKAVTDVNTYCLDKKDFEKIIQTIPQIKNAILGVAAGYSQDVRQMLSGQEAEQVAELETVSSAASHTWDFTEELRSEPEIVDEEAAETAEKTKAESAFKPRKKRKYPVLLQQSEMDCGAACLSMIARYYDVNISINRFREMANVTREGATLHSLAEAAENTGLRTRGIRADFETLSRSAMPAIAHWEGFHYIVVYRVEENCVVVADPAFGLKKYSREEFMKGWDGILLLLEPSPDLYNLEESKTTFTRFLPFIKKQKNLLIKIFVISIVLQLFGVATPVFTQNIIDKVLVQQSMNMLNIMLIGMLIIAIFQAVTAFLRQYMLVFAGREIDISMLNEFYTHLLSLPIKFFQQRKVGDIISRLNENSKIRDLLTGTSLSVILDFLSLIVYLSLMFYYNWKLTLVTLLLIPLFTILTFVFTPMMKKISKETFQAGAESQSYIVESISGINTVKAMAVEKPVRWKWEEILQKLMTLQLKASMVATGADSVSRILQTLSTTLILWFGAKLVMTNQISIGQMMAFTSLLGSVISPVLRMIGVWGKIQEARIAMERLNDVLDSEPEQTKTQANIVMPPVKGTISFKNVSFRYSAEGKNVLQNITLEIGSGQTVALVGRSGSGKTTLANLILRLYNPTEGTVLIDGIDIRNIASSSLRRQIGVVLQDNFLFSGTIRENIALGIPDPPMQDVITASMLAGAHDFISELPMGYETVIGERGLTLSGGQRQRLAIARALFTKPKILIMDEATSALDTESEKIIQQNLESIFKGRTTIVIAHRLSTVRNADRIVVMDRGTIVEQGTHYELMEKKGLYFYLNSQQLNS
jgi:subfamily B ATP-binding cassette protein HlyB/CyaB